MLELDGATLTYEVFRDLCLKPNRPAIIRNACRDATGAMCFDLENLKQRLAPRELCRCLGSNTLVPVYSIFSTAQLSSTCVGGLSARVEMLQELPAAEREEVVQKNNCCEEVPLQTVLHSWAEPPTAASCSLPPPCVFYLKDWHLQAALESAAVTPTTTSSAVSSPTLSDYAKCRLGGAHGDGLYRVPCFLGPDWMDSFCCRNMAPCHDVPVTILPGNGAGTVTPMGFGNGKSDYRFCYIGPVGSWTPLHCDVFGTYSWSLNVCGDKQWFFPTMAGNEYLHSSLVPQFPTPSDIRVLTGLELDSVVQHPGDLVFVPAFYYHQVHNVTGEIFSLSVGEGSALGDRPDDDSVVPHAAAVTGELTVALNHNWCNAFNVERMTAAFLEDVRRLASHLSVDDLALICDSDNPATWRQFADRMLHTGANWSFASMASFLDYCLSRIDSDADVALGSKDEHRATADQLRRLRDKIDVEYTSLFEKKEAVGNACWEGKIV